jgi:hypothetical protein
MGEQMVFQPNVALRILLWIFVIAGGQFPLVCAAQNATQKQAQIRRIDQELSVIQKEITALQNSISQSNGNISDEQRAYLKKADDSLRTKYDGIQEKMEQTAERLSGIEMSISYNYFTIFGLIFGLLLTLGAALGTLGALYIKRIVTDGVKDDVKKQIETSSVKLENEIKAHAGHETTITLAETLFRLSYAWWEQYQEDFRTFLEGRARAPDAASLPHLPTDIFRELRMARILSEKGMNVVREPSFEESMKGNDRSWLTRARLVNIWAYLATAELLSNKEKDAANKTKEAEILTCADALLEFAKDERTQKEIWFRFHETAAFALINVGVEEATKARGWKLIRDLCKNKPPGNEFQPPPAEWLAQVHSRFHVDKEGNQIPH